MTLDSISIRLPGITALSLMMLLLDFTAADVSLGPVPGDFVERIPLEISKEDVEVQFSRSGGAGGQNVNKVNTKAEVRLKLESTLSW